MIGGIVAGLVAGSTLLTLGVFFIMAGLLSSVLGNHMWPVFVVGYVVAVGIGAWGVVLGRARSNFLTGLLIGSAIGMLGGTALCNVLIAGMSNGGMR
jgi:hypothetical protein